MTPQQSDAIRRSFAKVAAFNAAAGAEFCEHLFAIDPELRRRFGDAGDCEEQGRRLMVAVAAAVRRLSDPCAAAGALRPRPPCPAPESHYPAVAEALMWTLRNNLGPECTPEVRSAWLALCDRLAETLSRN